MTDRPHDPDVLHALAAADAAGLRATLLDVCASPAWAEAVAATRPWRDRRALLDAAAEATAALSAADLREAMAGHARIGAPGAGDATAEREQSRIRGADRALLDELDRANAAYEAKFGHVFLICATGRTAATVLAALRERHAHDPATETEIARGELRKINDLRIARLLDGP
ncbi:2-oxo-4-hydroxy-4-carboxy-5-ureidoimidazoline decarboxylase [Kitasatospora sp. NPDC015120]|uniref:2-oxo-4-hydroxy-4-carboxy-5-ureidoimidazoline decarboxylase n=1 Tax=Kitasatospora sp. NPDC015120 TaxID=3364023 RepID=UPI0036F48E60